MSAGIASPSHSGSVTPRSRCSDWLGPDAQHPQSSAGTPRALPKLRTVDLKDNFDPWGAPRIADDSHAALTPRGGAEPAHSLGSRVVIGEVDLRSLVYEEVCRALAVSSKNKNRQLLQEEAKSIKLDGSPVSFQTSDEGFDDKLFMLTGDLDRDQRRSDMSEALSPVKTISPEGFACLRDLVHRCGGVEPPLRSDRLSRFADSQWREFLIAVVIFAHTIIVHMEVNRELVFEQSPIRWEIIEASISFYYCFDLFLSFWRQRAVFFYGKSWMTNYLELVLSVAGILDALQFFIYGAHTWTPLKLIKMFRGIRVLQLVYRIRPLGIILGSIVGSFTSLASSFVVISILTYLSSIVILRGVVECFENPECYQSMQNAGNARLFESIGVTMITLLRAVLDGFGSYYEALQPVGTLYQGVLLVLVLFIELAVLNIILGIVMDKAMTVMAGDRAQKAEELCNIQIDDRKNLTSVLAEYVDDSEPQRISAEQWSRATGDGRVLKDLNLMGLRLKDCHSLFDMVARRSEDGKVDIGEFATSCVNMSGGASHFDVFELKYAMTLIRSLLTQNGAVVQSDPL